MPAALLCHSTTQSVQHSRLSSSLPPAPPPRPIRGLGALSLSSSHFQTRNEWQDRGLLVSRTWPPPLPPSALGTPGALPRFPGRSRVKDPLLALGSPGPVVVVAASGDASLTGTPPLAAGAAPASFLNPQVLEAASSLSRHFADVDLQVAQNLRKVLAAFQRARVGRHHFSGTTGYGHNDTGGREALDQVFADIMGAEAAIVRSQFFSGTHAIATALFSVLRPGDELVAVAGAPYDTLEEVIGTRGTPGHGSLKELGVSYRELQLAADGDLDWSALEGGRAVGPATRCAFIQRSRGYSLRKTLSIEEIGRAVRAIKASSPGCLVVVDNCYGEFMEEREPCQVGADLVAGSLIKNPGGTLSPCGGYVAGSTDLVERAGARLSAPGIGLNSGSTPGDVMRLLFQGLFLAPQMVGEAVKSSLLISLVMTQAGYACHPPPGVPRRDIIQVVELGSREKLLAFCEAVQLNCPVGSYIRPTAGITPGYGSEVVFADGTFIDGSTIELSCDGPLREPYAVYCQGGTHWMHWAIILDSVLHKLTS